MRKAITLTCVALTILAMAGNASATVKPDTRVRAEIPEQYTWDLSAIYPNWEAWEKDLVVLQDLMDLYQGFKGTLAEGPDRILAASKLSDEMGQLAYKVYRYPALQQQQDTSDNTIQARLGQVQVTFVKFNQATAWFTPELLAIPEETMQQWLDETAELAPYRFGLEETYRQQTHVLDEAGEQLMAYSGGFTSTPGDTYNSLANADVQFPDFSHSNGDQLTASHAIYNSGIRSYRNQADREAVFKAHFTVWDDFANTYASIYNSILQRDWFQAQARSYDSTVEGALDGNNIPVAVLENLIETAKAGAEPLQRYNRIRKEFLGLERYRYFDSYIPLFQVDWPFHYDDAQPMVVAAVAHFGSEYQDTVQRALNERWIDVYENEGKRAGAFSAGVYGVHPYMLLNYADTMNDAFTLAHEMGHTMHTVLSAENQPFATSSYTIFVAEVASMTNEAFFLDRLLATTKDPKRRIALLEHAIGDIAQGFYRQTMFADYELKAHRAVQQGQPITSELLQTLYLESLNDFFGDSLDDQEWYKNTWARVSHFYNSPYYVYQYATSKAAASLLHRRMTEGDEADRADTVAQYLELLRSGGNDHPMTQLRKAGVDFG
ncbi:MAG: oligoendopeptidase F, partial [Acidobacteria bacterium]|nr:oligoendopeptidase F [Acidobacteriota bacterium]